MKFFGKYRGKVSSTIDPLNLGRIEVKVPEVLGAETNWAMPCTPYAGKDVGFFAIPPVGANIWVEFEGGEPSYPIWTGCFWGEGELPAAAKVPKPEEIQVFRTEGITITLSRFASDKGVKVEITDPVVSQPQKVIFNAEGIEINNNDKTTAKWTAQAIELKTGESSMVTIAADNIELKESSITTKLTASSIELTCSPATLKLTTASGIEIANSPASVKLSASGIELASTPATAKVAASGIELSNGAANVKLSPISVNINNGALEVI